MIYHRRLLLTLFSFFCIGLSSIVVAEPTATNKQETVPNSIYGKVTDIINSGGYTYAEVDTGEKKVWAAGPVTPLKKGDMIAFSTRMPMNNFHSKSMQRDFSVVYFIDQFKTDTDTTAANVTAMTSPHDQAKQQSAKTIKPIKKADGGNTIDEIYKDKNKLDGKTVRVRGQVTKFTPNIMGKNWLHIKDSNGNNDLTITSSDTTAIDDIVIIEGKLGLNKDFGYGYVYPLIVEDASIK